jgi:hypothetical protein
LFALIVRGNVIEDKQKYANKEGKQKEEDKLPKCGMGKTQRGRPNEDAK